MKKEEDILIGRRIKSIRLALGETTEEFAKHFDPPASKGTVSKWENGYYLPNNKRTKKISELGNISVDELLYGSLNSINNLKTKNSNGYKKLFKNKKDGGTVLPNDLNNKNTKKNSKTKRIIYLTLDE